jgi:hypothetical protein
MLTVHGAVLEYFNILTSGIGKFRLEPSNGANDFDQKVVDNIASAMPIHNELIEVFSTLAQYDTNKGTTPVIHKFFESLIKYLDRPEGVNQYHEWDGDNLQFIVQESFLLCITIFLKYERFDVVEHLISQRYFEEESPRTGQSKMRSYGIFRHYLKSLNHRNSRLSLRRLSLHADMLKERCSDSGISFEQVMQADFVLYVAEAMHGLKEGRRQEWWPETLVFKSFRGGTFELFLRAESKEYFDKIVSVLGVKSKSDLDAFVQAIKDEKVYVPKWDFDRVSPLELMNF